MKNQGFLAMSKELKIFLALVTLCYILDVTFKYIF